MREHFAAVPTHAPAGVLPEPAVCRVIRRTAGMSQWRAAEILGVRQAVISRWESGRNTPTPEHAAAWLVLVTALREGLAQ